MKIIIKTGLLSAFILLSGCQTTSEKTGSVSPVIANAIENRDEIKPVVLIEAMYPREAFEQNIEGYCRVSFDIKLNESSKPHNIEVLECSPKGVFEQSCINAVKKWFFIARSETESPKGLITTCKFELSS